MKKDLTFEEGMARLEEIVTLLENGKSPLDESLSIFEEGVSLVNFCNTKLSEAEQRVRVLVASEDGVVKEVPFTQNEVE